MAKKAARTVQADVVVLGCHPSAFFAVSLLKQIPGVEVVHASLAGEQYANRLVLLNPRLFELHPLLADAKNEITLTPTYGRKRRRSHAGEKSAAREAGLVGRPARSGTPAASRGAGEVGR